MRYILIPAAAAIAFTATSAFAADILSCSYHMPPPPPPGHMMHGHGDTPPPPPPGEDASDMPPPPPPPPAPPTVASKLACTHGTQKMQGNLAQLTSQGWNFQSAFALPGSVTFILTK